MRDRMGRYISSTIEGTYMKVNNVDLPTFVHRTDQLEGAFAAKAEGIWEIEGDFLGGPFVSYAILDEDNQEVVYIDGFVYSPEKKKKMRSEERRVGKECKDGRTSYQENSKRESE